MSSAPGEGERYGDAECSNSTGQHCSLS
jgi:hypothetical protein